ncbi:MAG: immunoglobulin domain-containing protein, partial [Bacteroidota bacterium]|nr:immunoglobulin domain-containing protein [Bacteroidota bacterium]
GTALTVKTAPSITTQPTNSTICSGSTANFSLTATGSATLTYQWYDDDGSITGATNNSYSISSADTSDEGSFYCVVSNSCSNVQSNSALLTVNEAPSISYQTSSDTLCENQSMTFTVTTTGTTPINYQWFKNNDTISNATGNSYTINSVSTSDAATYKCKISNTCGNASSSDISLSVNTAPVITSQPTNSTVCNGNSTSFNISVSGSNYTYQWYNDDGSISGANSNSISLFNVDTSDAGNYYCVVSNNCANTQSNSASLTINESPSITYQTPNTIKCENTTMAFNVSATGTTPFNYQWYFNNDTINGATSYSYTISNLDTSNTGQYYCKVSNSCGNISSTNIALTVNQAPSITTQPSNAIICSGSTANFSLTASGTSPITYQWYGNNGLINGATNNSYSINNADTSNTGSYYCIVTNSCGVDQSLTKTLTVQTAPDISSQTSNTTKCENASVAFNVNANGSSPISYQWYFDNSQISGATNNFYSIGLLSTSDAGQYYCKVSNTCGINQSNNISLTVKTYPDITTNTSSTSRCEGQSMTFSVSATGSSPISYQWYNNSGSISSATNNLYDINVVDTNDEQSYYCIATNICGNDQSKNIALSVNTKPDVNTYTDTTTICVNDNLILNITANSSVNVSYEWYHNSTKIPNAINSFYLINYAQESDSGEYICEASNICGTTASSKMTVLTNNPITIISESGDSSKCVDEQMSFEVTVSGTAPISYQWFYNSDTITGATAASYLINEIVLNDAGNYYCKISNPCGTVTSTTKHLSVYSNPVVNLGNDTTFCYGGSITLSPGSGYFCKWNTGSQNPDLTVTDSGNYYVKVRNIHGCSAYSDTINVEVLYPFASENICVVTIDENTSKNLIAWERTGGERIAYYNVYKESTFAGNYVKIGSVLFDSTSVFVDVNSNPKKKADRYKISAVDSCNNESDLSPHHKTMHLSVNKGAGGVMNLIWDHYEGFSFGTYKIYRGTHPDSMNLLDDIQSNLTSYTDLTPPAGLVLYQVAVDKGDTCYPKVIRGTTNSGPFSQSLSNLKDYNTVSPNYLSVSEFEFDIDSLYGSYANFDVFTNLSSWNVSSSQNWLNVTTDFAMRSVKVTALSTNSYKFSRTAFITLSGENVSDIIISVNQYGTEHSTDIEENNLEATMFIYPNPFKHLTNIVLPSFEKNIKQMQLIDINGRVVRQQNDIEGNKITIYKNDLSKGLYFVRVITDRIYQAKVIVR